MRRIRLILAGFLWYRTYLLNKPVLDLREVTINSFVHEALPGHLPEVGSVQPLLIEKILLYLRLCWWLSTSALKHRHKK